MPAERRSEEAIRREIASEREQLADAVKSLRAGIEAKRRPAALAGAALAAGVAVAAAFRVVRRIKGA